MVSKGGTKLRPDAIHDYIMNMRFVDNTDAKLHRYSYPHKAIKWTEVALYGMMYMGLSNSHVLYEQYVKQKTPKGKTVKTLSWKEFVLEVAEHWVPEVTQPEDHSFVIKVDSSGKASISGYCSQCKGCSATYSCVTCSTTTNPVYLHKKCLQDHENGVISEKSAGHSQKRKRQR